MNTLMKLIASTITYSHVTSIIKINYYRVCHGLRPQSEMAICESLLTTFKANSTF